MDAGGRALCLLPEWAVRPHAWVKLWKHHAAQPQADRINALAAARGEAFLADCGGKTSSEWLFAKALQMLEEDPQLYAASDRLIEAADWVVWQLTGTETRNACTAGYKAMYQDGHYPQEDYFAALHPDFARANAAIGFVRGNPVLTAINESGKAGPDAVVLAVAQALVRAFGDKPLRLPSRIHVVSANRPG